LYDESRAGYRGGISEKVTSVLYRKMMIWLGRKSNPIAIGLLGGWYMKGQHKDVVDFAIRKLIQCNGECDDLSVRYFIGYAISSLRHYDDPSARGNIQKFLSEYHLSEDDCINTISK